MMLHGLSLMTQGHLRLRDAYCLQGRHVIIEPRRRQAFHLDGEVNRWTPFTCTVLPGALKLLAPVTAPADLFCRGGEPFA